MSNRQSRQRVHSTGKNVKDTDVSVSRVYDGDVYVRVNTVGTTGTRPFVLVPGIGVSSTYFERLAPNLNEFGPVHAIDLPGFGGVPHPGKAMSIQDYATLLGLVIDKLELDDPVLVGHSMGTQVVTELVSRRPELSTVVLIGPVVNPAERHVALQARRFLQASWHEPAKVKVLAVGSYLLCGFKWFSRILPKMMHFEIEKRLPLVQARTLIIRGQYDAVCPRDWVEEIGRLVPRSRLWEIPDAAHSVMHAHAAEVARLCVAHAKNPITAEEQAEQDAANAADDQSLLQIYEDKVNTEDTNPQEGNDGASAELSADSVAEDLELAVKAAQGRITETVGIFTDDDEAIARGKTLHAEAMKAADET